MTLLDRIKNIGNRRPHKDFKITTEELEVVNAWLADEVSVPQISKVLEISKGGTEWWLLVRIRELYKRNNLK